MVLNKNNHYWLKIRQRISTHLLKHLDKEDFFEGKGVKESTIRDYVMLKILTAPLSWIYGFIIFLRHKMFDTGVLKSTEFDIPIVCVGNITVGGTGKTPHIEYLISLLSQSYQIAVLSRGYKRKSKGFLVVEPHSHSKMVGDEPKQIKLKFPDIPVAVCEKRVDGVHRLRELFPNINLILLDDGFQHRYIQTWLNIVLMDYEHPVYEDHLLPWGRLRDLPSRMDKADIVIVTKCPSDIKPIDMRVISKHLNLYPYQSLFFTKIRSYAPIPLYGNEYNCPPLRPGQDVIVMAAIANPDYLIRSVSRHYHIVDTLIFSDHHSYKTRDLKVMEEAISHGGKDAVILVTDKDAVKLSNSRKIPEHIKRRLYRIPIEIDFINDFVNNNETTFFNKLTLYVTQNQRHAVLNPE